MDFSYDSLVSTMQTRLSLLSDWASSLFLGVYQRIIDLIAYTIEKAAYYAEYFYNEASFVLATRRDSVIPLCKVLSYTPYRKVGPAGNIILSADPTFSSSYVYTGYSVVIPKWTQFKNSNGDVFVYSTEDKIYYNNTEGNLTIPVAEGVYTEYTYTAIGNASEVITIYSDSIDNSNIEVYVVDESDVILETVNICGVNGIADELFFINDLDNYYCKIENANDFQSVTFTFGDGVRVKQLTANVRILIKYAVTNGSSGNITSTGIITEIQDTLYDAISQEATLYVTNTEEISNGLDIESLENIQYYAPYLWQSGYRAGTKADWKVLLEAHPYINKAKVWSNEDLLNPSILDVNKIFATAVSADGGELTSSQQSEVTLYMKDYKSPSEVISWEDLQIVWLLAKINARIEDVSFDTVDNSIASDLDDAYGILNVEFQQNIYESDFVETLNDVDNIVYHNSDLYNMEKNFNALTNSHQFITFYNSGDASDQVLVYPTSVELYLNTYNSGVIRVGNDADGDGVLTGENGHSISGGSVDYNNGLISFGDVTIINNPDIYGTPNISGTVTPDTYQLSVAYQTTDAVSGQVGNIRLPHSYLITDVDSDYLITTLEYE